ncbi:hypothetical protein [Nitratifractor sp.]|uniref:hypothetical protein n=1 Tax=Nitratifractor sp. TaxID=2268144 RepID=UPI0025FAD619|nr:hypothetical protein [Nitratifractor sp.]
MSHYIRFEAIKERLDGETVERMLEELGYRIRTHKTALREERTPSTVIYPDGHLHDFGAGKSYDIFDILTEFHGLSLPEAKGLVKNRLGLSNPGHTIAPTALSRPKPPPPHPDIQSDALKAEFDRFQRIDGNNQKHRDAIRDVVPEWLFDTAHKVDRARFETMARFDPGENCLVAGCFDEEFRMISYKWRRKRGIKWYTRPSSHSNRAITLRTLRTRPGTLHVIEGHRDALTATLLGINWIMLPTASWRMRDRSVEAVARAAHECGGHLIRFWAEDTAAYDAMRPFAERIGQRFNVEIRTYPGVESGKKLDLSDFTAKHSSIREVRDGTD